MINVRHNIRDFERALSDLAKEQLPFAMARALTQTADAVKAGWEREIRRRLDRPTPFTQRGLYRRYATKRNLTAEVGVKRIQASYLKFQAEGGVRRPTGRAIVMPVRQRLNVYGNMPKGAIARALGRDDTFSARIRGVGGIWKRGRGRKKRELQLVAAYRSRAQYRTRLDLDDVAERIARRAFPGLLAARLREAMATAR